MRGTIVGRLRLGAPVVLAALFACLIARAGDPPSNAFAPAGQSGQRTLLLSTGRVVEGRVNSAPGGYMVELPNGSVLIPTEHVMFEADNLPAVYHKLRESFPTQTAVVHVNLARWCLNNGLEVEARRELVSALQRDSNHEQARSMLRRLQAGVEDVSPADDGRPNAADSRLFAESESQSLAGLSRDTAQQFVLKIQPILMNKCGFSRCHGSTAKNEFRLTHVLAGAGSHRVYAERNLAAVAKYIDVDAPDTSRLLAVAMDNHGRGGRAIFYGNRGTEQFQALQEWVRSVGRERQQALQAETAKPSLASIPPLSPQRLRADEEYPSDAEDTAPPRAQDSHSAQRMDPPLSPLRDAGPLTLQPLNVFEHSLRRTADAAMQADDEKLRSLLSQERLDAFDPDKFNRAVHGRTAREIKFSRQPSPPEAPTEPAR